MNPHHQQLHKVGGMQWIDDDCVLQRSIAAYAITQDPILQSSTLPYSQLEYVELNVTRLSHQGLSSRHATCHTEVLLANFLCQ